MRSSTRKRIAVGLTAASAALALFAHEPNQDHPSQAKPADTETASESAPSAPTPHLPERASLKPGSANLFGPQSPERQTGATAARAERPVTPRLPYRVAGKIRYGNDEQVLLSRDDVILPVKAGDTLDGVYYVLSIDTDRIDLVYLPLGSRISMTITSALDVMTTVTAAETPAIGEPTYRPAPGDEGD